MYRTAFATVALLFAAGAAAYYYQHDEMPGLPSLKTVKVARGNLQFTVDSSGVVQAEEVVDVGAQVAGRIQGLGADPRDANRTIDYGSPVHVGTVLARIDDALYQTDVEQAQAQVESAQALAESTAAQVLEAQANVQRAEKDLLQLRAKLFSAERDWQRAEGLWRSSPGALSESEYDLARSTYEAADAAVGVGTAAIAQANAALANARAAVTKARADLGTAQAVLKRAQTNLGYCTIKSPVDGVIIDRRINVGQTVVSSLNSPSLFLIAKDLKRMQVWASVNEADIGHIRSGQKVSFTVDAHPRHVFQGVVAADQPRLNASMTQNVVTYTVVVNTDNADGRLLPYLTADLQFEVIRRTDVLYVPNAALRWRPSPERLAASGLGPIAADAAIADANQQTEDDSNSVTSGEGTLWIMDGGRVRPVRVQTGITDGTNTEVASADLLEGMEVVVAEAIVADGTETTNPFSPRVFGGGTNRQQPQQ